MKKIKSLGTRENMSDNIKAVTIVQDEINRFRVCQTRKKVVNHEEYIRGLIDMGLKLDSLTIATGKKLLQDMAEQKRSKMRQLDNA